MLTSRRQYQFDYSSSARRPSVADADAIYALHFNYPPEPSAAEQQLTDELQHAVRPSNMDYWYCGSPALKPVAASDDGVHTRLRFAARSEQPAVFVENDDGSESLLNFSVDAGDVIVHRVVRRLIVRRGKLSGRISNEHFQGVGQRLSSGTTSPHIDRQPVWSLLQSALTMLPNLSGEEVHPSQRHSCVVNAAGPWSRNCALCNRDSAAFWHAA